jgi:amino acid adenylation domain-containing protein
VRLEDRQNFREVVQQVRETLLGAFGHADLPFEQMVEMAVKERVAGQQPLYQVMFVLLEEGLPPLHLDLARGQLMPMDTGTSKNDLTLNIQAVGETWDCQIEYATDLFSADGAARMARDLTELFRTIAENSRMPFGQFRLMPEEDRRQIAMEWNRTEREYPRDKCLHQLFEEQVERTPDAVAVVFKKNSLTYRELNNQANRLANHLRGLGVGPESLVALCLERSLEMIVAILGTLKAGGAYVPIDPAYPADRVAFMLADANAPVLLTQEALRKKLPPTPAKAVCLDSGWKIIERESEAAPASGVTADNLAYVIYTSGSTGKPKGAMNTHRGICNRLLWMQEMYQLTGADCVLQKTPFSFDISVWEFFWPLLTGARLVIARPDGHRDSQYLIQLIINQQITTLHFVPSMLRHFLQETEAGNCLSLRQVFCGGEALPWDLQETFFKRLPGVPLHNLYGPTEAAVDVTHWTCKPNSGLRLVPIGRPIANIQIYILDEELQPVPVGTAGELHIGGVGLARGYLNQPELTAERFVSHPFSDKPDARLYRTGDLARWLPDGNIEFLGRMDQQVKIRGFRIELGEIESVLCQHPDLSAGAVTAQPDGANEMELAAFVVARDASALSVNSLRQWLAEKLPDYMIPSRFVAVLTLPLTPNGKLDRKALAKLDGVELATGTDYTAPRNELERTLVEIWQTVFRRERVGIRDNFFELGGHSLLAALIGSRINRQLGIDVPLRQILEHPTIETLAGQMR